MTVLGDTQFRDFRRGIISDVLERAAGVNGDSGDADFKENAFTQLMIEYLADAGVADDGQVCFIEKQLPAPAGTVKANGYYISEDDGRVDLFYTVYSGSDEAESLTAADAADAVRRCMRLFGIAHSGDFQSFEESSEAFDMLTEIHAHAAVLKRLRIFVLSDKVLPRKSRDALARQVKLIRASGGLSFRLEVVDLTRLHRIVQSGAEHEPIVIDMREDAGGPVSCVKADSVNPAYDVYLAVLPGKVLHDLYDEYGSRLLELNVRAFLQATGKVNKGIRETLRTEPSMFLPYNNGISATADQVETEHLPDGTLVISKMTGLQVVNGGQTMASIHRACKSDRANISDVLVQAKITVVSRKRDLDVDDLVHKISLYANSQNKVNEADFSANDPFHVKLEQLANSIWVPGEQSRWFYERARGSYQTAKNRYGTTDAKRKEFERIMPASQKFTKTDFAKYMASYAGAPHVVSLGGQKNFVRYMDDLKRTHGKNWLPDDAYFRDLVALAILNKETEKIVRDEGYPAYRANVVSYVIALLASKTQGKLNLGSIWVRQQVSSELREMLRSWSHDVYEAIIASSAGRNVTEWCKKEACWESVRDLPVDTAQGLPEMVEQLPVESVDAFDEVQSARRVKAAPTMADLGNIARVMGYSSSVYREIARWGTASELLTDAQVRLAIQLQDSAVGGWEKTPTSTVAKRAQHVLDLAEKHLNLESEDAFTDDDWLAK